jgi:hypothetical protein
MSTAQIARALLYEGYLLYPYRASALKNRRRWAFGALFPPAWREEHDAFRAECLLDGAGELRAQVRFLHLRDGDGAVEREVVADPVRAQALPSRTTFTFDGDGHARVEGELTLSAAPLGDGLSKIVVELANRSPVRCADRDQAALHALASAHVELRVAGASWISLADPPERARAAAQRCRSEHVWPVLLGDRARCDTLLCTPVLLEDFPRIAPESPHDLFDGGEIDEILTLRILTLSDAEKAEVRATDPRARALLERVERLSEAELRRLHGGLRRVYAEGDRVRLQPRPGSDILDFALAGRAATVVAVEQDLEGRLHLAVVLDDDPGRDLGAAGLPGHRFFFAPDDVEPLA